MPVEISKSAALVAYALNSVGAALTGWSAKINNFFNRVSNGTLNHESFTRNLTHYATVLARHYPYFEKAIALRPSELLSADRDVRHAAMLNAAGALAEGGLNQLLGEHRDGMQGALAALMNPAGLPPVAPNAPGGPGAAPIARAEHVAAASVTPPDPRGPAPAA